MAGLEPDENDPNQKGSSASGDGVFGHALPVGKWAGVAIGLHWSVLVTIGLFASLLATSALPDARPGHSAAGYWVTAVITSLIFLVTLLAHELAHAIVARHYRMRIQRITLWMLGGMTELDGEPQTPRADALIALAGPAASLLAGGVCAGICWLAGTSGLAGAAVTWLAGANLMIGAFNLLPGTPLDGGRLVRAALWHHYHDRARAVDMAAVAGRALGFGLAFLGILEFLAGGPAGLWLALIGWFIIAGASAERYAAHQRLQGLRAGELMAPAPFFCPEWWTIERFLAALPGNACAQPLFPLVNFQGQASGTVAIGDLGRIPLAERQTATLRDLSRRRRVQPLLVTPDEPIVDIAARLRLHGGVAVVVDAEQRPLGLLTEAVLLRGMQLAELGWRPSQFAGQEHRPAA